VKYLIDIVDKDLSSTMDVTRDYSDAELKGLINRCINNLEQRLHISKDNNLVILQNIFNSRRKLGIIQSLLDNPEINEIMINGTNNIFVERAGKIEVLEERFDNSEKLFNTIQTMVSKVNRVVNESNPIVDARLDNGSRVHVVLAPIALNGPVVTIRKFSEQPLTLEKLLQLGSITFLEKEYLEEAVRTRRNIFISGGTSTGKTTFLNALSRCIPSDQRVVTIEDSAELQLNIPNVVRLETKNANTEGKGSIPMRQLIKASLRMRPDRIIVGEVRDEAALDMLNALCTGHSGSMSTGHANSAIDMLTRLETMALWEGHVNSEAIKRQIAAGINIIVHLTRDENLKRFVSEIVEIIDYSDSKFKLSTIFKDSKKVN